MVSERIAEFYEDHPFWGGLTYSGHPLACAAGLATLEVYEEEDLIQKSKVMGQRLLAELNRLKDKHPSVGDARGIGLFCALELVKDKGTKEMLVRWNAANMGVMAQVRQALIDNGLYAMVRWNIIFLAPPLCINEAELMQGIAVLDEALNIADAATA
jgi:taurine--2-oxoglutarate transaminase